VPHSLIFGMTESGKTSLAKQMAAEYRAAGISVLVLDPLSDPDWSADYITSDPVDFSRTFWDSQRCAVFIDEAGDAVGRYDEVMARTATRGRHWGHNCHYITQRGMQLAVTVRDQCSHLFLFTTALNDSKTHANEWNQPELVNASTLAQGQYYHCTRFGDVTKNTLFIGDNTPHEDNDDEQVTTQTG